MEVLIIYDYLNGDQVKCFYIPIYYPEGSDVFESKICHSGGDLRGFANGDTVPYKTYFYKYPKNFVIMSYDTYYTKKGLIFHIIKDGVVFKTVNFEQLIKFDFKTMNCFIDYYGRELNINSIYSVSKFCSDSRRVRLQIDKIAKNRCSALNNMASKSYEIQDIKEDSHTIFNLVNKKDICGLAKLLNDSSFLEFIIDEDNCLDIISKSKETIVNNEKIFKQMFKLVESRLNNEFNKLSDIYDIESKNSNKIIEPIREKHSNKWFTKDKYSLEKIIGEYYYCLLFSLSEKEAEPNNERYIKEVDECISDFKKIINQNHNVVDNYLTWTEENQDFIEKFKKIVN